MRLATTAFGVLLVSLVAVSGDRAAGQQGQPQPFQFHLMEATIPDVHRAIQEGQITCRALVQAYVNRARAYNGTCNQLVTEEMAPTYLPNYSEYKAAVTATAQPAARRSAQDAADRVRPHGADRLRSERAAAVRHDGRHSQRRPGARARDDQHPRRAVGDLQGRLRSASLGGPAAGRRAGGLRGVPPAAGRAGARRGARRAVRPQSRPGGDADVLHSVLVQGPVRHEGHAVDRRRRRALRHRFPGARPHAGRRSCAHKGAIIYAKANTTEYNGRGPGNPGGENHPTKVFASTLGYQRSTWAGNPVQLVRHDARRLDRLELGLRRLGRARTS